jgi:hypothetical protein
MNIDDQATAYEEKDRALLLAAVMARANAKPLLTPNGICNNCDEQIKHPLLFCDANCRDDWQLRTGNK